MLTSPCLVRTLTIHPHSDKSCTKIIEKIKVLNKKTKFKIFQSTGCNSGGSIITIPSCGSNYGWEADYAHKELIQTISEFVEDKDLGQCISLTYNENMIPVED